MGTTTGRHISGVLVVLFLFGACGATTLNSADAFLIKNFSSEAASVVACMQFCIKIWAAVVVTAIGFVVDGVGYVLVFYILGLIACLGVAPLLIFYKSPVERDPGVNSVHTTHSTTTAAAGGDEGTATADQEHQEEAGSSVEAQRAGTMGC